MREIWGGDICTYKKVECCLSNSDKKGTNNFIFFISNMLQLIVISNNPGRMWTDISIVAVWRVEVEGGGCVVGGGAWQ